MRAQKTADTSDGLKDSLREAIGKLVGDSNIETEGKSQQRSPKSGVKPKTNAKL